jgi:hypothetical protein
MSSNLATSVPDQAIDQSTFTNWTPLLKPSCMLWLLLIGFMLPSFFGLRATLIRYCTGLMMCLIHIDESTIHMSIAAWLSCLCVPFSKKLNNLLDRLDNCFMMHNFQYDVLKWVCGNQNDAHYCNTAMLHGL